MVAWDINLMGPTQVRSQTFITFPSYKHMSQVSSRRLLSKQHEMAKQMSPLEIPLETKFDQMEETFGI